MRARISLYTTVSLLAFKRVFTKGYRISGPASNDGSQKARQRELKEHKKVQNHETKPPDDIPYYNPYYSNEPMSPPPDPRRERSNCGEELRVPNVILTFFFVMTAVAGDFY